MPANTTGRRDIRNSGVALFLFVLVDMSFAQEFVDLPYENPTTIVWKNPEREYFSDTWNTSVVTNVSAPVMEVFRPTPAKSNGSAVVIAPGGGFHALSIESEGNQVARWLAAKGFTAFVLRYRLVPTGQDGVAEIPAADQQYSDAVKPILRLAIADGLNAVSHVRENASRYDVAPDEIGFMGFSAGGSVAMGVTFNAGPENLPDFIVPVYADMGVFGDYDVPGNAPPMLVICASDDSLGLARDSVSLYSAWHAAGVSAGLHMYSRGNHGFGMRRNNLPSDNWIERFYEWSLAERLAGD